MVLFETNCEIPLNADDWWFILNSNKFGDFQAKQLGFKKFEELSRSEESGKLKRKFVNYPNTPIPSTLQSMIGNAEFYITEEHEVFLQEKYILFRSFPPFFQDYSKISGKTSIEALNNSTSSHKISVDISISLMFFGSLIENLILSELQQSFQKLPEMASAFYSQNKDWVEAARNGSAKPDSDVAEQIPTTPPAVTELRKDSLRNSSSSLRNSKSGLSTNVQSQPQASSFPTISSVTQPTANDQSSSSYDTNSAQASNSNGAPQEAYTVIDISDNNATNYGTASRDSDKLYNRFDKKEKERERGFEKQLEEEKRQKENDNFRVLSQSNERSS